MTSSAYLCLKYVVNSICKPLGLIFKQALTSSVFPCEWKKGNIFPCYKKGDKQNLKNYPPVSLLPICGNIFERLRFNEMFFFWLTISQHLISLVLNQVTLLLISFYELFMRFIHHLMVDLKLEEFSWIYIKPWRKSGMKVLYLNLSKTVLWMTCKTSCLIFYEIGIKELNLMVSPLHGPMLVQEFLKDLSQVHYFF